MQTQRQALTALLVCTLALPAAASAAEPQLVHFDSLDGTPLKAWAYQPGADAPTPKGTVIALHGCGGLYASTGARKGQISARHQAMAEMLVQEGYAVLMPDSLTPRGVEELCTQKISQRKVAQRERRRDTLAALSWVAAQPWGQADRIAVLGWSHGGSAVLGATDRKQPEVVAQTATFSLAIAFYPGCSAPLQSGYQANTRLVMLLGEKDDWTPPGPCVELGKSVGAEVHVYPGSYHGFDGPRGSVRLRTDVPGGVNPGQGVHVGPNPAAREQAYARVRELLREAFRP